MRESFGEACSAIVHAVRDSLGLDQVLARMATATRLVVPFDAMGLFAHDLPGRIFVYTLHECALHGIRQRRRPTCERMV